jgi:hypothetical protein
VGGTAAGEGVLGREASGGEGVMWPWTQLKAKDREIEHLKGLKERPYSCLTIDITKAGESPSEHGYVGQDFFASGYIMRQRVMTEVNAWLRPFGYKLANDAEFQLHGNKLAIEGDVVEASHGQEG